MIKYQVNILYICVFIQKCQCESLCTIINLQKRGPFFFFNPLLCTISIWKALRNRQKAQSKNTQAEIIRHVLHWSTNINETNYTSLWGRKKQTNYKKRKVELHPYSILHLSSNNNYDNTTLITFQGVNTSAEWIKKGKSKKVSWQRVRYRSRVSSETTTATNQ